MDGHLPSLGWSPTNPRMVTLLKEVYYRLKIWYLDLTYKNKTRGQLPNIQHFHQGVHNLFSIQEMELSKQEMELYKQEMELILLFHDLQSKNLFYKMFLTFTNESKTGFENRKWNYFSYFLTSD